MSYVKNSFMPSAAILTHQRVQTKPTAHDQGTLLSKFTQPQQDAQISATNPALPVT